MSTLENARLSRRLYRRRSSGATRRSGARGGMTSSPTSLVTTGLRCLKLLEPRSRGQLLLLALAILAGTAMETIGLTLIFPLLHYILNPAAADAAQPFGFIFVYLPANLTDAGTATLLVVLIAATYTVKNLILLGVTYMQFSIIFNNERDFACRLFNSYLDRPFSEMLDRNTANLIRNVREVVNTAFKGVIMGFVNLAIEGLMIAAILGVLVYVQPYAAIIAITFLVPSAAVYQWMTRRKLYRLGVGELDSTRAIIKAVQEGMHSLKSTKVFGREHYFGKIFRAAKDKAARISIVTNTIHQTPRLWFESVIICAAACIVIFMLLTSEPGAASPILGLFAVAMLRLMPSMNRLSQALNSIRNGTASLETLQTEYIDAAVRGVYSATPADTATLDRFARIRFEHVTHTYPSKAEPSLHDISLEINAGETVALVGPSGAGKTTAADLLLGLLQPTEGVVSINGTPLPEIAVRWRELAGYVPQQVYVSDDTLRRNVAFALPDDDIDDTRVLQAMKDAQIDDLVQMLPLGLDTPLGEHGRRLSVGQVQRVGIARALYDAPAFLVLDEATSALDIETENEVTSVIAGLAGKLTIVIIAHKLITVKNADRIILLRSGRFSASGTFKTLIENSEDFARMVDLAKL